MRQSKAALALVAILLAAMSVSAFARGRAGGGGARGGQASSHGHSTGAGPRSFGGHAYSGAARAPAVRLAPQRHFAGGTRIGVFIGAPLYAPMFYPVPSYYYAPPPVIEQAPAYIEQAPTPAYWYFCPESNAYYPYVQECPAGWQPVLPQPSARGPQSPG